LKIIWIFKQLNKDVGPTLLAKTTDQYKAVFVFLHKTQSCVCIDLDVEVYANQELFKETLWGLDGSNGTWLGGNITLSLR